MNRFVTYGLCAVFLILPFALTSCADDRDNDLYSYQGICNASYKEAKYNGLDLRFEESEIISKARAKNKPLWDRFFGEAAHGRPKEAIAVSNRLYNQSLSLGLKDEAARAKALYCLLSGFSYEDGITGSIVRLKKEIPLMDVSVQPLMYLLLGKWYLKYFNSNRWDIVDRPATADFNNEDFRVWDAKKFFDEIDYCYEQAFKAEEFLQKTPLSRFQGLLEMGDAPVNLRPTLFDFAVYDALDFYKAKDNIYFKPYDGLKIDALSDAFADAQHFSSCKLHGDRTSRKYKALKLYQKLLSFHKDDSKPDAFIDGNISRLNYVYNNSVCADERQKREIYIAHMESIVKEYPSSETSAMACYYCADAYLKKGDAAKALELIDKAKKVFPDSKGAVLCLNLERTIKGKELKIICDEMAIPGEEHKIIIYSRNVNSLTLTVYKRERADFLRDFRDCDIMANLQKLPALKKITFPLDAKSDYKASKHELSLPPFEPGFYTVVASCDGHLLSEHKMSSRFFINSSRFALVKRNTLAEREKTFVVEAYSGKPVIGAKVELYNYDTGKSYNRDVIEEKFIHSLKTDKNGLFDLRLPGEQHLLHSADFISVSDGRGSETFERENRYDYSCNEFEFNHSSIVFFTDQSVYYSGQKIFFKAIALFYNCTTKKYSVLPAQELKIILSDLNGEKIDSLELITNEFGSVYGSLKIPEKCFFGKMKLFCSNYNTSHDVFLRVEEYRRPKFFVELEPPKSQLRPGDKVTIYGHAKSYSGGSVSGAKVVCGVNRSVTLSDQNSQAAEQIIDAGIVVTDENGRFSLSFTAEPDLSVDKSLQPVFNYEISADVTDAFAETRSGKLTLRLGYCELQPVLSCDEWQTVKDTVKIEISTFTIDGQPVETFGKVRLVSLKQPSKPMGNTALEEEPALDDYSIKPELNSWPVLSVIEDKEVKTSAAGFAEVFFSLRPGAYRAEFSCYDKYGKKSLTSIPFIVVDEDSKQSCACLPSYFIPNKTLLSVGETLKGVWGTGYKQGMAYVQIFKDEKILKSYWTAAGQTQVLITVPITEELCGGFTVSVFTVKENRFYSHTRTIDVPPRKDRELKVTVESLRSKLWPGKDSSFTIKVCDANGKPVDCELLVSLYDISLDSFWRHQWNSFYSFVPGSYSYVSYDSGNRSNKTSIKSSFFDSLSLPWNRYPSWPFSLGLEADSFYGSIVFYTYELWGRKTNAGPDFSERDSKEIAEREERRELVLPAKKKTSEPSYFYPNLRTGKDGAVTLDFKIPDSLKNCRLMAFAHTPELEIGYCETEIFTQKKLMVKTIAPPFLQEGDEFCFAIKADNLTTKDVKAEMSIDFFDPFTLKKLNVELKHNPAAKVVAISAGQSRSVFWQVTVPKGLRWIAYRASGKSDDWTDSEESRIPVVSGGK